MDKFLRRYHFDIEPPLWEISHKKEYGDFSTMIALKIGSVLKDDSLKVASELKSALEKELKGYVDKIDIIKPGFVNIFVSRKGLIESLNRILKEKSNFFKERRKRKVILEFVSANPTGPLSIAHGRQAVVGDVISRIFDFFGNDVLREYYLNDEGRQIELLVKSTEERIKEIKGEKFSLPKDGYPAEYVKDIACKAVNIPKEELKSFVISHMISLIKSELSSLGIDFDNWFSQKELLERGKVKEAIGLLKRKGFVYEKDNAVWFLSSKFGDDKDRVLIKSDGKLTYFASDVAYHRDKAERGFDRIINLWGPDHHGYINRVKAVIKAFGYNEHILKVIIIQLVTIKTKERMSRRKGTAVLLSDLINEVGKDAVRFYYLLRRNSSPLEFDIDLAKSFSFDNPLYYIQYAHARIKSIFRKAKIKEFSPKFSKYLEEEELYIIRDILQFAHCLDKVYYSLEPVFLIEYLKKIAVSFHHFYERKRVLGDNKNKTFARLNLLEGLRVVLKCGLEMLGINAWDKM